MALGEINANYSYVDTDNHAKRLGERPYYEYFNKNLEQVLEREIDAGENLTGYGLYDPDKNPYEPFQYWYDDEEKAGGGGHYYNIRDKRYGTTGFGCSTTGYARGMYVATQEFDGGYAHGASDSERVLYTTDELRAKLKEFIALTSQTGADAVAKAQQAVSDAQAAVDSAKSALTTVTANVATKQAAVTAAQNSYDAAKQSYQSDATAKVAAAQQKLNSAEAAKSDADAAVTAAQTAISTARSTLAAKNAELASAKQAKNAADATVAARQADVDTAKAKLASIKGGTAVTDAQEAADAAEKALADAKQKASEAANALATAKDAAAKAQSAYDTAVSKLTDANAAAEKARRSAQSSAARSQAAYGRYAALKGLTDEREDAARGVARAEAALRRAQDALEAALRALPGLSEQARQFADVAGIVSKLPQKDAYLADPALLMERADALLAYSQGDGLTAATKEAAGRYRTLLLDAYECATDARGLEPRIETDRRAADAADAADAALLEARVRYEADRLIAERPSKAAGARRDVARPEGPAVVAASVRASAPRHLAQGVVPGTGDVTLPFLPFGVAGALAALAGAVLRRRME